MTGEQYEELCRLFVARQEGLDLSAVESVRVPNASRLGVARYSHQIDLRWETDTNLAHYVNIANAKWRRTAKIDQGEMLQLQKVREEVDAHKAFMFTNIGFTRGARAVAEQHGIGLHVVDPQHGFDELPERDRGAISAAFSKLAASGESVYRIPSSIAALTSPSARRPDRTLAQRRRLRSHREKRALYLQQPREQRVHLSGAVARPAGPVGHASGSRGPHV